MAETVVTSLSAVIVAAVGALTVLLEWKADRDRKQSAEEDRDRSELFLHMVRQLDAQGRLTEICAKRLAGIALNGDVSAAMESAHEARESTRELVQKVTSKHI